MKHSRNSGFTLIEMLIVLAVSVPLLLAMISTSGRLVGTVNTADRNARVSETVRTVAERAGRLLRSAHRSTLRVRATSADVAGGDAADVGDWIVPTDLDPRPNIQFQASTGRLAMNAADLTMPQELDYVLDPNELPNDLDDDGDGLVDEGKLWFTLGTTRTALASGVEACSFELDGEVIRLSLQCAEASRNGQVSRTATEHVWWLRN